LAILGSAAQVRIGTLDCKFDAQRGDETARGEEERNHIPFDLTELGKPLYLIETHAHAMHLGVHTELLLLLLLLLLLRKGERARARAKTRTRGSILQ
tara:strand:+ start:812 stop:1102 length:291 start_codon:yes stop_codon:yes gene_type:complete